MDEIERDERRRGRPGWIWVAAAAAVGVLAGAVGTSTLGGDDTPTPESVTTTGAPAGGGDNEGDGESGERDRSKPDPDDVEQWRDAYREMLLSGVEAWQPNLSAETLACVDTGATLGGASVPLDRAMTEQDIIEGCFAAEDEPAVVCMADSSSPIGDRPDLPSYDPDQYLAVDDYPLPVVALGGSTCDDAGRPLTEDDLSSLNWRRSVEVTLRAVPGCADFDDALEWVETQLAAQELELEITTPSEQSVAQAIGGEGNDDSNVADLLGEGSHCYGAAVHWQAGTIEIMPFVG